MQKTLIKSRVLAVSGATGFVGKALVKLLIEKGYDVRVLSRQSGIETSCFQGARWCQGDLCHQIDSSFLSGVDTIYHLAAELTNSAQMEAVNVKGTANLLAAAKRAGVRRWIQLSSVGVYGVTSSFVVSEETTPKPANKYERTKLASDRLVDEACRRSNMENVTLRPSNIIGADMKNGSFFALVKAVSRGRYFFIGPRGAIATYVHVEDVVRALVACQEAEKGSIYNLSSDCTWEALIECIAARCGVPKPRYRIPEFPVRIALNLLEGQIRLPLTKTRLDALTRRCGYSSSRIINDLKFRFSKPMPEGICDLVG